MPYHQSLKIALVELYKIHFPYLHSKELLLAIILVALRAKLCIAAIMPSKHSKPNKNMTLIPFNQLLGCVSVLDLLNCVHPWSTVLCVEIV